MSSNRHNARKAVVQALYQWDITQQNLDDIETQFVQIHDFKNVDRRFFTEALDAIPAASPELESKITPFLDRSFKSLDPVERAILRLGAYELIDKPDVPTNVIINEMIELAKVFGAEHSYKFVNGVMDKLANSVRR